MGGPPCPCPPHTLSQDSSLLPSSPLSYTVVCNTTSGWVCVMGKVDRQDGWTFTSRKGEFLPPGWMDFYCQEGGICSARKGRGWWPTRLEVDQQEEWRLTEWMLPAKNGKGWLKGGAEVDRGEGSLPGEGCGCWPPEGVKVVRQEKGWMLTTRRGEGCPPCKKTGGRWPLGVVGRGCAECGVHGSQF